MTGSERLYSLRYAEDLDQLEDLTPLGDEEPPKSGPSLWTALLLYGGIAVLAGFTLDGTFRLVVWVFLGGLAIKTWIAALRKP